jgi:hypothetical protein
MPLPDRKTVDDTATKSMRRWVESMRPGVFKSIQPGPLETATCEHCGRGIFRESSGHVWKHWHTLREECEPRPVASPKRDRTGNTIPLVSK